MFITENFHKVRLQPKNIKQYLQENHFMGSNIIEVKTKHLPLVAFLQSNYGKEGDCSLTSILTITKYYNKILDSQIVYDTIEEIAEKKYFYNGDSYGTIPTFIRSIANDVFKRFNLSKRFTAKYIKGVGFNLKTITSALDADKPVILSIFHDGRGYYDNHSITVVGYTVYKGDSGKEVTMLLVHDNWHDSYSYVDYSILSPFSCICY